MKTKIILFTVGLVLLSYTSARGQQDGAFFKGKITIVKEPNNFVLLKGEKINLKDNASHGGYITVYDSLILFSPIQVIEETERRLSVFSLNSGKLLGSLSETGEVTKKFSIGFSHSEQFIADGENIKLWTYNPYGKNLFLLNLTKWIKSGKASFDDTIEVNYKHIYRSGVWNDAFIPGKDSVLLNGSFRYLNDTNYIPTVATGHLFLLSGNKSTELRTDQTFILPQTLQTKKDVYFASRVLSSATHRIKPDRRKTVMGMHHFAQINILDIKTGKQQVSGLKSSINPDELLQNRNKEKLYYSDIAVNNNYIFGLYLNRLSSTQIFETDEVHVFDWNGNFVRKIKLDKKVGQITVDPVKNLLYGNTQDGENLYRYHLDELKLKTKN
jgi:hypothetical protein